MGFFGIYCLEGTFQRFLRPDRVKINDNNDKATGGSLRPRETRTIGMIVPDSRSRLDVATTEAEIRRNREKLNRLLGLGRDH
jgi:hypothetical protein